MPEISLSPLLTTPEPKDRSGSEAVDLFDQLGSAFMTETAVGAAIGAAIDGGPKDFEDDPNFKLEENLTAVEKVKQQRFAGVRSFEGLQARRDSIAAEEALRANVLNGPLPAWSAYLLAGAADPTNYVFGTGFVRGAGVAANAIRVGTLNAAVQAGQEAILRGSQDTRTAEESMLAVSLSAGFGGLAGGVGGALVKGKAVVAGEGVTGDAVAAAVEEAKKLSAVADPPGSSLSAAGALDRKETELVGAETLRWVSQKLAKVGLSAPAVELGSSARGVVREFVNKLASTGMLTRGEKGGDAVFHDAPLMTHVRALDRRVVEFDAAQAAAFDKYLKRMKATGDTPIGEKEFFEEVGRATFRRDKSAIPEAAEAAASIRANVYTPMYKEMNEAGVLEASTDAMPRKADPFASYSTRVIDHGKIDAGILDQNGRSFEQAVAEAISRGDAGAPLLRGITHDAPLDDEHIAEVVGEIMDKIRRSPVGRTTVVQIEARGPLHGRVLDDMIDDDTLLPWLVTDVRVTIPRYIRSAGTDIAFKRVMGDVTPDDWLRRIRDDFTQEIQRVTADLQAKLDNNEAQVAAGKRTAEEAAATRRVLNEKAEAKVSAIKREMDRTVSVADTLWNRIRGTDVSIQDPRYAGMRSVTSALRAYTFTRSLGSVVFAQIPDLFRLAMAEGFANSFRPVFTGLTTRFSALRLGVREGQLAGGIFDLHLNSRMIDAFDLHARYGNHSKFDQGVGAAGAFFSKWTGMNHWNTMAKGLASSAAGHRIVEASMKLHKAGGDISVLDHITRRRMATSRLSVADMMAIGEQAAAHSEMVGGVLVANTERWADKAAVRRFRGALLTDVDNLIISPSAVDAPLWTGTDLGKTIFLFRRFGMAATHRILVNGLQARDANTMIGAAAMLGAGYISLTLRDMSTPAGRERIRQRHENTGVLVRDVIDRSGLLGSLFEIDTIARAVGLPAPSAMLSGAPLARHAGQSAAEIAAGPAGATIGAVQRAVWNAGSGEFTESDLDRLTRLLPFNNHALFTYPIQGLSAALGDALDLEEGK